MALRQVKDTPTNTFATLNPLSSQGNTLSEGNLKGTTVSAGGTNSTMFVSSGKWYWEIHIENHNGDLQHGISEGYEGIGGYLGSMPGTRGIIVSGSNSNYIHWYSPGNTASQGSDFNIPTWSTGDIICFLLDFDTGSISVRPNDSNWIKTFEDVVKPQTPAFHSNGAGGPHVYNFGQNPDFSGKKTGGGDYQDANGQGSFYYQVPAGALALCSRNIQSVEQDGSYVQNYVSAKGNFQAVIWSGDNQDNRQISTGFQPDLVWLKARTHTTPALIFDSVRGFKDSLAPAQTTAEGGLNDTSFGYVSAASQTEFTIKQGTTNSQRVNETGRDYVAWYWRAAGAPVNVGDAKIINEDGTQADTTCAALTSAAGASITPTKVSANRQNGFSIVKYTSPNNTSDQTVPHGLSQVDFIIVKNLQTAYNWDIYHSSVSNSGIFTSSAINTRNAFGTVNNNVFTTKNTYTHSGTDDYIAYCWHSVEGYSKSGSYVGNGSVDGPYVELGFRPAWVMCKCVSTTNNYSSWIIYDSARAECNPTGLPLHANSSVQEGKRTQGDDASSCVIDFLSNGFKFRNDWSEGNRSNEEFIFMAFAEQPGAFSNAR